MTGLYAIVDAAPAARIGSLRVLRAGGLFALVGAPPPAPTSDSLRAYDGLVRQIAASVEACLPARYGAQAPDDETLVRELQDRGPALAEALSLVRGREQMTLRIHGEEPPRRAPPELGPGARYLEERRQEQTLPELAPLRAALGRVVRAERVERREGALANVYHLIDRGSASAYVRIVEAMRLDGVRVAVSGPWPAWSFAPEVAP